MARNFRGADTTLDSHSQPERRGGIESFLAVATGTTKDENVLSVRGELVEPPHTLRQAQGERAHCESRIFEALTAGLMLRSFFYLPAGQPFQNNELPGYWASR